jgi:hypothetical protein
MEKKMAGSLRAASWLTSDDTRRTIFSRCNYTTIKSSQPNPYYSANAKSTEL